MNLAEVTLEDLAHATLAAKQSAMPLAPAMAPARQPVLPVAEHLRGLSVAECRARLREEQNLALHRATNGRWGDKEAREWSAMDVGHKVCLLILAGVGDSFDTLTALAERDWREIPPPEKEAIKHQVREARAEFAKACSLAGKW